MYRYLDIVKNRVRELRAERGVSQVEVAAALGVSRQTVIAIEKGHYSPSLPLAFRIANYFDSTVDEMFDASQEVRTS
jgi:putative transcriptional regulator